MKKYFAPAVEIQETEMFQMMALSKMEGSADSSPVLSPDNDSNIWADEDEE